MDRSIKKTINYRKARYNSDQKTRLEDCGKTSQWYNIAIFLSSDETPERWSVPDLKPGQKPEELAKDLSEHFLSITNTNRKLISSDIPVSTSMGDNFTRLVTELQVESKIKSFKIPKAK